MPTLELNTYTINMVSAMETPGKTYRSPESTDQRDCTSDFGRGVTVWWVCVVRFHAPWRVYVRVWRGAGGMACMHKEESVCVVKLEYERQYLIVWA